MIEVTETIRVRIASEIGKQIGAGLIPQWNSRSLALGSAYEVFHSTQAASKKSVDQIVFIITTEEQRAIGFAFTHADFNRRDYLLQSFEETKIAEDFLAFAQKNRWTGLLILPESYIWAALSVNEIHFLKCIARKDYEGKTLPESETNRVISECAEVIQPVLPD
jgi:hypothetical protein